MLESMSSSGPISNMVDMGTKIAGQIGNARTRRQNNRHFKEQMAFNREQFELQKDQFDFQKGQFQEAVKQWGLEFALKEFATRRGMAMEDVKAAYEQQSAGLQNRSMELSVGEQEAAAVERAQKSRLKSAYMRGFTSGFQ